MWKYRSKSHLLALLISFFVGCGLGYLSLQSGTDIYEDVYPAEVIQFIQQNHLIVCLASGLSIAGIINIIRLTEYFATRWNFSPILVILLVFLLPDALLMIGVVTILPAAIASLIGIYQLHKEKGSYGSNHASSDEEIVRLYQLHHPLQEDMCLLGQACRKNAIKIRCIYALGVVAAICVIFFIQSITLIIAAFLLFVFAFNIILRYKSTNELPILSLLVQKCDPVACASAILYYSQGKRKTKIQMHIPLAQCLIYMDDPALAQDVLALMPRKDRISNIQYWTIMSYIYYLLKDEKSLERCKEELGKMNKSMGFLNVFVPSEEMGVVQNKIDLMNGELNVCRKYYLNSLKRARFPFQQVEASYFIGLISFVEEDYPVAELYFNKVVSMGNRMCFVEKAQKYLDKLNQMDLSEQSVE